MSEDFYKDITFKVLKGHATAHEKRMLVGWLQEDPAREEIFYYCLSIHESTHPQYLADIRSPAEEYDKFLRGESPGQAAERATDACNAGGVSWSLSRAWWAAASVLMLLCSGFFLFRDAVLYRTYSADSGVVKPVLLADGSCVTLNANSSIKVYRDFFHRENRDVWIKGEAFFEVTRTADLKRFIVHTKNFDVVVHGTKFNVNDRRGKTQVVLEEGKVTLLAKHREPLIMRPGEQVTLSKAQDHYQKEIVRKEGYEAWRNNKMTFENTPLTEVAQIIQDYYGIQIAIADSLLASRQFTGTLPNNDLNVILLALKTAYPVEIERTGHRIIIKKIVN
jgi:transmembrane sensor